jgi:predicted unusual protein kinase regulating ubiquinone biosynthesis (AarF/ABC1/UbiB family)
MRTSIAAIKRDPDAVAAGFVALGLIIPGTPPETVRWLAELLIANAYSRTTTKERIDALLADRVMKTLFDFPIVLPQHLVYFGRTAALIEGVGTRYDPYFQAVPVASPVILRMRSRILRSLGEPATPSVAEVATVAGYALGKAARWLVDLVQPPNGNNSHARKPEMNGKSHSVVKTVSMAIALSVGVSGVTRAQGVKDPKVDTVRFAEVASGKLRMPKMAAMYQIFGKENSWDRATGKVGDATTLLVMISGTMNP